MKKFLFLILIISATTTTLNARRGGGLKGKLAMAERIDLHIEGGGGLLGSALDDSLTSLYHLRLYPMVLAKKSALRRVPKKYRKLVGPEPYLGYLLWPSNFIYGFGNGNTLFVTDWQPISIGLFTFPKKNTIKRMRFIKITLPASVAYKYYSNGADKTHSVHFGVGVKGKAAFRIMKFFSLKGTIQKLWLYGRDENGNEDLSLSPLLISGGFVLHFL